MSDDYKDVRYYLGSMLASDASAREFQGTLTVGDDDDQTKSRCDVSSPTKADYRFSRGSVHLKWSTECSVVFYCAQVDICTLLCNIPVLPLGRKPRGVSMP